MDLIIEKAKPEDAAEMLAYLRQIGGETDNLTFGKEGLSLTVEQEQEHFRSMEHSSNSVMFLAKLDGRIAGTCGFSAPARERLKHRGEMNISVLKSAWGLGIGTKLMEAVIDFARNTAHAEIIFLEVRSDNHRAIRLYEKFGFEKTGVARGVMKIDGKLIDCDLMSLYL